jgi:hypothetical protein
MVAGGVAVLGGLLSILAFIWDMQLAHLYWGATGAAVAFFVAPITFVVLPWLALVDKGAAGPLLFGYGGAGLLMLASKLGRGD